MERTKFYIVNALTLYRLVAAPLLLVILFFETGVFKWLLPLSYLTDAVDGFFAKRWRVSSRFGAVLDSVADDLTVLTSLAGMAMLKPAFFHQQRIIIIGLLLLFLIQSTAAFIRYGKMSSFHTYGAKAAAVAQGCFFILCFLLPQPLYWLFYLAAVITAIELLEEIIIVMVLPSYETDVRGLYWIMRRKLL